MGHFWAIPLLCTVSILISCIEHRKKEPQKARIWRFVDPLYFHVPDIFFLVNGKILISAFGRFPLFDLQNQLRSSRIPDWRWETTTGKHLITNYAFEEYKNISHKFPCIEPNLFKFSFKTNALVSIRSFYGAFDERVWKANHNSAQYGLVYTHYIYTIWTRIYYIYTI